MWPPTGRLLPQAEADRLRFAIAAVRSGTVVAMLCLSIPQQVLGAFTRCNGLINEYQTAS